MLRALALALLLPALAAAQERPRDRTVKAILSFSVEEYDPSTPSKAVMRCVVRNDSPFPVHVPVGFDAGYVRVQSGQLRLSRARQSKDDVRLAWVEPGHEQVVFELPLVEVLSGKWGKDAAWHWNWDRRPEPPHSPIHQYRKPGFLEEASFVASLTLGNSKLTTEPASLKVKPAEQK